MEVTIWLKPSGTGKLSVVYAQLRCNAGLRISPDPTFNFDGQLRKKLTNARGTLVKARRLL